MTFSNSVTIEAVVNTIVYQYLFRQGECEIDQTHAELEALDISQKVVKEIKEVEKRYSR